MIANEQEYRITSDEAKRFEEALAHVDDRAAERHPLLQRALRESLESELQILREQLAEFEARRRRRRGADLRKHDLVRDVARRTDLPTRQVRRIVDALLDTIRNALAKGERISLGGFGSFATVQHNGREGVNPRTGEKVAIGARKVPRFRAGSALKRAVDGK